MPLEAPDSGARTVLLDSKVLGLKKYQPHLSASLFCFGCLTCCFNLFHVFLCSKKRFSNSSCRFFQNVGLLSWQRSLLHHIFPTKLWLKISSHSNRPNGSKWYIFITTSKNLPSGAKIFQKLVQKKYSCHRWPDGSSYWQPGRNFSFKKRVSKDPAISERWRMTTPNRNFPRFRYIAIIRIY